MRPPQRHFGIPPSSSVLYLFFSLSCQIIIIQPLSCKLLAINTAMHFKKKSLLITTSGHTVGEMRLRVMIQEKNLQMRVKIAKGFIYELPSR